MSPLFAWEWSWSFLTGITGLMMTYDQQKCTRSLLFCGHIIRIQSFWHGWRSMNDFLYCIINLNSFKFRELSPLTLPVGSKDDSRDAHLDFEERPFKGIGCERWNFESCKWREVKPRQDLLQKECHNIALPQYWPAEPWKNCSCH